jgi:hypothetical protein
MRFSNGSILFAPILLQGLFENVLTRNDTYPSGHGQIHKGGRAGGPKGLPKSNGAEKGFPVHAVETIGLVEAGEKIFYIAALLSWAAGEYFGQSAYESIDNEGGVSGVATTIRQIYICDKRRRIRGLITENALHRTPVEGLITMQDCVFPMESSY